MKESRQKGKGVRLQDDDFTESSKNAKYETKFGNLL